MKEQQLQTPCYVIDEDKLEENLKILKSIMDDTGCRILLAQKCFSAYKEYPLIANYLCGATASGIHEARLCHERMQGKENHIFSPAYREDEIDEILRLCDHIVFNSVKQLEKYGEKAKAAGLLVGIRINPEKSTQEGHEMYDPCAKGSRLGITIADWEAGLLKNPKLLHMIDGFHFHTLCEQNADALEVTFEAFEEKFAAYFPELKWLNFGGGHHITREDYDRERLIRLVKRVQDTYGVTIYLEPGEAVALNAGYLYTTVLEVQERSDQQIKTPVIVDASAACHMPDVLEMPYRPPLKDSGAEGEKQYTYAFGGPTCLAGDSIGIYSFDRELKEGDRLVFEDMAIYSMVKNNTFNGMKLPAIYTKKGQEYTLWKQFGYEDFKMRL